MRKKIRKIWFVLICIIIFSSGCGSSKETVSEQKVPVKQKQEAKAKKKPKKTVKKTETKAEDTETEEAEEPTEEMTEQETEESTQEDTEDAQEITATEENFDYVALGNSITCNEVSDLWWGNWGMAASSEEKDYVHLISAWLGGQSLKPVTTTVLDLKKWEVASDRDSLLESYEKYFNEYTDLVTIQTGENITEFKETLGSDYLNLISRIKEKAPNAQILVLGEILWPSEDIEAAKRQACEQNGVQFIDMSDFLNGYEGLYKSAVGNVVFGMDGQSHSIGDEVVAAHPNDDGMACIAQQVINQITVSN